MNTSLYKIRCLNLIQENIVNLQSVAGYYRIGLSVTHTATGTGGFTVNASIYKNGAAYKTHNQLINYSSGYTQTMMVTGLIYLNGSTDYIEGYFSTNSPTLTSTTGSTATHIEGEFVRL